MPSCSGTPSRSSTTSRRIGCASRWYGPSSCSAQSRLTVQLASTDASSPLTASVRVTRTSTRAGAYRWAHEEVALFQVSARNNRVVVPAGRLDLTGRADVHDLVVGFYREIV